MQKKIRQVLIFLAIFGITMAASPTWAAGCGNTLYGTQGPDLLDPSYEPPTTDCQDFIFGRSGDDVVHALGGDDQINGDGGNDTILGQGGNDNVQGGGGDDVIEGGEGDDTLNGESNDDRLFGGPGNDTLFGASGKDYLDGGPGQNESDGATDDDLIVGRSAADLLKGGPGDDFLVIVGNSTAGYQLEGDTGSTNTFDDLLFFARDANPQMVSTITVSGHTYQQLSFDLRTQLPVEVNLAQAPRVEAVATGDGADHLIGTDTSSRLAYFARFQHSGTPLSVNELFFAAAGNDLIETLEGSDYVDAGAGDDTVKLGSGAHYIVTGSGKDLLVWPEERLKNSNVTTVTDFAVGDRIQFLGSLTPSAVTFSAATESTGPATTISYADEPKILLLGVSPGDARVQALRNGVEIRVLRSIPSTATKSPKLLRGRTSSPR